MKDKSHYPPPKGRVRFCFRVRVNPWCWVLALWLVAACAPQPVPPPLPTWPSRVITRDGVAFTVHRLRFPGTSQDLILRDGGAKQWLPLNLVQTLRFSGSLRDRYRPGEIILISGEKMRGEVFVDTLVEGATDVGYWNMPFSEVERLDLGTD